MSQPKKLIEVGMPIKEISAESVRDKSIRHGHISTLHLWWARRPLPVCRAVVFASLVPDPLDDNCPQAFRDAVTLLLGRQNGIDSYKPYEDIPYTAAADPMEDNLRNRLLMFIGKFSEDYMLNEKRGRNTPAKDQLNGASLIKWDNKDDPAILDKARKLIWVAHNVQNGGSVQKLLTAFDNCYGAIIAAEREFYDTVDRHIESAEIRKKESNLRQAIDLFLERMPKVFDPFAGGGAIPLESSRLGCSSYGNDINPVAHIVQKGSLEFPQRYGKRIVYSVPEFIRRYGKAAHDAVIAQNPLYETAEHVTIDNRLAFDVEYFGKELLRRAEEKIGQFYPADDLGKKPVAYYWARVGKCGNPSCRAEIPLLKSFYLSRKPEKQVYLKPIVSGTRIDFEIVNGEYSGDGWVKSRSLSCPVCGATTDSDELKRQSISGEYKLRMLAVIDERKIRQRRSVRGSYVTVESTEKYYRKPFDSEVTIINQIPIAAPLREEIVKGDSRNLWLTLWGINQWGDLFLPRQLLAMQTLVETLNDLKPRLIQEGEYGKAVITYLAILLDRIAAVLNSFGRWNVTGEKMETPFSKQAIPMMFDFPEGNPFSDSTGSGKNHLAWILRYIRSESSCPFFTVLQNASSGKKEQFPAKSMTTVVTDPPYYDAMAYADLSDFFYVWLKRSIGDLYQQNFATPYTPKTEECTALKHHHNASKQKAKEHFESKLLEIFNAIEHQTSEIVSVMFAHQTTEAWTTLCNSILGARLNITGSWAIDTEMVNRSIALSSAALESSVTVCCKPTKREGLGEYREIKSAIESKVNAEVENLHRLGFRGADLLTACFGKAVGEFGKYERVEKASGDQVTVAELLEMTRESAFNALLKGFKGDDFTKFYIGWLELYGFSESAFDDAAKFTRVGLSINVKDLFDHEIFIKNGNRQVLARFAERIAKKKNLGESASSSLIDQAHRAMALYKRGDRRTLLDFIGKVATSADSSFWRVLTSLDELLPKGTDDQKQVAGLLENKDNLIRESQSSQVIAEQLGLPG